MREVLDIRKKAKIAIAALVVVDIAALVLLFSPLVGSERSRREQLDQLWQELQRIPRGTTRTYSQVARALGRPKAVRAVARACATNPVSVVVPCHRVIREDGSLAGYRWGVARKEQLLAAERATAE